EDLYFDAAHGLLVTIHRSKADQEQEGAQVAVPYAKQPDRCAVRALRRYLDAAAVHRGAVFRQMRRGDKLTDRRLSNQSVALMVEQAHPDRRRAHAGGRMRASTIASRPPAGPDALGAERASARADYERTRSSGAWTNTPPRVSDPPSPRSIASGRGCRASVW